MSKKSLIFLAVACVAAIILFIGFTSSMFWISIGALAVYLFCVIVFSILAQNKWLGFVLLGVWMLPSLFSLKDGILLFLIIALPSIPLFFIAQQNFALRVKVDFAKSTRPALYAFFISSALLLSVYIGMSFSLDGAKNFVKSKLPQTMEIGGESLSVDSLVPDSMDAKLNEMLGQCGGDKSCEQSVLDKINEGLGKIKMGTTIDTEKMVNDFFDTMNDKAGSSLSVIIMVLIAIILVPLGIAVALLFAFIFDIFYVLLRTFGIIGVKTQKVDQEVLI